MPACQEYVFVLWASGFEETMATVFVTQLRRAGLCVKVVGLTQRRARGIYGLALVPDLTLEQALSLANKTLCLVIPATPSGSDWLRSDPRLVKFIAQAHANQARFVIGRPGPASCLLFPDELDKVTVQSDSENLITQARQFAGLLLMTT